MDTNKNNVSEMELIAKVQLSGSLVAKSRDTIAFKADTNKPDEGFIFAPQKKEIYNINELKKAVNVEVVELIPNSPETELDLVPRPLYEEALEALSTALETIEVQTQTIGTLEAKITELESEIDILREEVDNEKLLRVLAEENGDNLREELLIVTSETQISLQRSIIEGIEKSSLEAKNEGLSAQVEALKDEVSTKQVEIDSLTSSIEGKEAQVAAGAKAGADITVLVTNKTIEEAKDITYRIRNKAKDLSKWINGPDVEVYNFTAEKVSVTIKQTGQGWVAVKNGTPSGKNLTNSAYTFNLDPNQKRVITFTPHKSDYDNVNQDTELRGTLTFATKNGTTILTTALQKQYGGSYKSNPKLVF